MKSRFILPILLVLLSLTGCAVGVSMFPMEGPLRAGTPVPILVATVENVTPNSGPFRVTYPNGDLCEGRWASIAPQMVTTGWGTIFTRYGAKAGVTTISSNVPGVNRGEAMAVCKSGNQIQASSIPAAEPPAVSALPRTTKETYSS